MSSLCDTAWSCPVWNLTKRNRVVNSTFPHKHTNTHTRNYTQPLLLSKVSRLHAPVQIPSTRTTLTSPAINNNNVRLACGNNFGDCVLSASLWSSLIRRLWHYDLNRQTMGREQGKMRKPNNAPNGTGVLTMFGNNRARCDKD